MINYWKRNDIIIRAFEERDMEMYLENNNKPDSMRQWYNDYITFPQSQEEVRKSVENTLAEFNSNDKRLFVAETTEGEYAGEVLVWHTDRRNGVFRYGIFIEEKFRGRGFGKDALIIVLDYYFNELNYQKCSPSVYSFNNNSQMFHEKFGFVLEGRLRNDVYTRGEYHDMLYYGMLKSEFNAKYSHFEMSQK